MYGNFPVIFMILFVLSSCGGATEEAVLDADEQGEALDSGDASLVNGVQYLILTDADSDGYTRCQSVIKSYEHSVTERFCIERGGVYRPRLTLRDADGKELFYLGDDHGSCMTLRLSRGDYEMEVCHPEIPASEGAGVVFIAPEDVSILPEDAADMIDEEESDDDPDGGFDYSDADGEDYTESESPRFLSTVDQNTFITLGDCVRCDLSNGNFNGVNFTALGDGISQLTGANLSGANLTNANLSNAVMSKANLNSADLDGATLTGANLTSATIKEASLQATVLIDANLTRARLDDADLTGANLTDGGDADAVGANLSRARLDRAIVINADMTGATLNYAVMSYADAAGVELNGAANLTYLKAGGADFTGATFNTSNLGNAFFSGANMTNADLTSTTLNRTRFNSTNLTGANLTGATLTRPNWSSALLTGATWQAGQACNATVSYYDPTTGVCQL